MTLQEKREWLARASKLQNQIKELKETLDTHRAQAEYISPGFEGKVKSSVKNNTDEKFINIIMLEDKLNGLIDKKQGIIYDIICAIETVDNELQKNILYARYVNFKSIKQIANSYYYSDSHVERLLHQGVNSIEIEI